MHHAHMNMKGHQFPPSNEKVSKASLFINKLALYLEKTSIHGIPYVVRSDRIYMKLMWIIIFLVFAGYCCYSIVNSFFTFFGFEVDTNIEILRDSNALFPTISICILQQCGFGDTAEPNYQSIIQQTIQQQFNKSGNLTQSALDNIMKSYNLESLIQTSRTSFLSNYSKTELNTVFSQLQNKTIQKNVISCQYSSENCYENDFAYFQTSEFQSCFKFNSGQLRNGSKTDIKQARRYGKNYGLQLEMFVGLPEKCISPLISTYGVTLYVHNSSTQIDSNTNGIALSPGTQNSIAIDRTFVTKMPAPYSDCVPNTNSPSDYPDKPIIADTFRFASRYTQFTCMQICYQHYLVKTYQCYNRFMPMYPAQNVSACPLIMDSPSNSIYYDMSTFYNTNEDNNCLNECPQECEFVIYDKTASNSQFPTVTYSEVLSYNQNVSENFYWYRGDTQFNLIQSSTLAVNVFYKNDLYTQIQERPALDVDNWISNIGGTLGLFVGAGFLSLLELFELATELIILAFARAGH